jgi:calcineurin-like phosphoesterase family protein
MSKKFVSADHHWFHESMIRLLKRPFSNVKEMNDVMVERWNSVVAPNDLVYYGGDMFYKGRRPECNELLSRLHGKIHFVEGNHDGVTKQLRHRFESWQDMLEINHDGELIVLCHYAMRVWNKSFHGSYHVYGHSHGQLPEDPASLSFDIGVDCWNFYPVSLDEVIKRMREKAVARGDLRVEPNR